MKFDVEDLSSVRKKINVVMPKEKVGEKIDNAYNRLRRTARIKGFRPGKAPRHILEKQYRGQILEEVLQDIVKESYPRALETGKITPVSYPEFDGEALKEGEDFAFSFSVDVKPSFDPVGYEGVSAIRKKVSVSDEEIDREVENMRKKLATLTAVDGEGIREGDVVTFDFEGFVDGRPLDNGRGENATLEIGSGRFIPGFEEGLIGFKKGESGELKARFPEDYDPKKLSGKEALFRINVKEVKRPELPAVDDDFARDVGAFDNLAALKARIASDLKTSKEEVARKELRHELVDQILKKNSFDVPQTLVQEDIERREEETRRQMAQFGMPSEEVEKTLSLTREESRKNAEKRVRSALLLEAIAEKEKIEVGDEDVKAYFEELSGKSGRPVDEIRRYFEDKRGYLQNMLLDNKILAFLESKAKIEEK